MDGIGGFKGEAESDDINWRGKGRRRWNFSVLPAANRLLLDIGYFDFLFTS